MMTECTLCPRRCGVDRTAARGACGAPAALRVSRVSRHMYEEPPISGTRGSGTVFFSGCSLSCLFCQNRELSRDCLGEDVTPAELASLFLRLRDAGVHNVNLVTPTHYTDRICEALAMVKGELGIPVVWNCGGYELPETLELTRGLVDIYMPDFKYVSPELAEKFSAAPDYADRAAEALRFMVELLGPVELDGDGLMTRGVLVRHLVLPGCRRDSIAVLRKIAETVPVSEILLGLMSQYTPDFYVPEPARGLTAAEDRALSRRVTTYEYETVRAEALRLGFDGFMQSPHSATTAFTPHFTKKLTVDL